MCGAILPLFEKVEGGANLFKWVIKKRLREQLKLFYQNEGAIAYLLGYFQDTGDERLLSKLRRMEKENRRIWASVGSRELCSLEDTEFLLKTNKELRRLYDQTAGSMLESFDEANKPLLGWDEYFNRNV